MIKKSKHMWTKDEIRKVQQMWISSTKEEICETLKLKAHQVMYIVVAMRKAGFNLPKKHSAGHLQSLLKEVLTEK